MDYLVLPVSMITSLDKGKIQNIHTNTSWTDFRMSQYNNLITVTEKLQDIEYNELTLRL